MNERWKVTYDDAQTGEPVEVTRRQGVDLNEDTALAVAQRAASLGNQNVTRWWLGRTSRWEKYDTQA